MAQCGVFTNGGLINHFPYRAPQINNLREPLVCLSGGNIGPEVTLRLIQLTPSYVRTHLVSIGSTRTASNIY